jgi:hypothetical protein
MVSDYSLKVEVEVLRAVSAIFFHVETRKRNFFSFFSNNL